MNNSEWQTAHSFSANCSIDAAYKACINALLAIPGMSIGCAEEKTYSIEASVKRSLWARGEDLRIFITSDGDVGTLVDICSDSKDRDKDRRNYDDLECAVRCQLSRLTI
jgi:hypothetical protein